MTVIMKHTQSFWHTFQLSTPMLKQQLPPNHHHHKTLACLDLQQKLHIFSLSFSCVCFIFVVVLLVTQACILHFVALTQWCEVQELGLSNAYVVNKMVVLFWCNNVKA